MQFHSDAQLTSGCGVAAMKIQISSTTRRELKAATDEFIIRERGEIEPIEVRSRGGRIRGQGRERGDGDEGKGGEREGERERDRT